MGMSWSRVARRVALARCSWPVDMSVSPQQDPGPASWMWQPAAVSTSRASWATPGARASEKESTQSRTLGPPGVPCWGFLPDSAPAPFCQPAPHSRHQQRPVVVPGSLDADSGRSTDPSSVLLIGARMISPIWGRKTLRFLAGGEWETSSSACAVPLMVGRIRSVRGPSPVHRGAPRNVGARQICEHPRPSSR